ncbi:MAG: phasin family protein [Alphaproteobacteria bacterium]|nr:phasin family protein [Alphaproteobacteria bacterium]MBV8549378.1 phasin family protein [Alphaproteobacteria bacterium]
MSEQVEKATQAMITAYEELNKYTREAVDASVRAANAFSKGWEETARSTSTLLQDSVSRAMAAGKTIASAKNIRDVVDTHNEFVKDYVDAVIANTGKITEISARVTKEVVEPIAQHATETVSRIMQKARAA